MAKREKYLLAVNQEGCGANVDETMSVFAGSDEFGFESNLVVGSYKYFWNWLLRGKRHYL